jgi:hypothetical protein
MNEAIGNGLTAVAIVVVVALGVGIAVWIAVDDWRHGRNP